MEEKIIKEEPITQAEVKEILSKISKDKEELEYVQKKTLTNVEHLVNISAADAQAAVAELEEQNIDKEKAIEVVNLLPRNREEIRTIFSKERKQPETEELDKILEVISKYRDDTKA
jgi:DNA-directed RNA polymerase subunit F